MFTVQQLCVFMLVVILLLSFVVDSNIVAYVWMSLVVTLMSLVGVNWGLILSMTPLVYFYFYGLQANFVITVGLKVWYGLTLSILDGGVALVVGLLSSVLFLGLVEVGLVWLRIRGIYFLGLTYVGVCVGVLVMVVYGANLSSLAVMSLVLAFPLTLVFLVKVGVVVKLGVGLVLVLSPILSFSLGYVGVVPPNYWALRGVVSRLGGVMI